MIVFFQISTLKLREGREKYGRGALDSILSLSCQSIGIGNRRAMQHIVVLVVAVGMGTGLVRLVARVSGVGPGQAHLAGGVLVSHLSLLLVAGLLEGGAP